MFNRPSFTVKRKAKRYKRWLEKVYVYPYPYEIAGRNYYLVDYVKLNQPIGSGIFSDTEEVTLDAQKAHRFLYQFYRLSEKIRDEGKMRANVNFDFFKVPLGKMDENPNPKWNEAYAFINDLLNYQLIYKKAYVDFWDHIKERNEKGLPLTEAELDLAIDTAAKLTTIQYHVVKELSRNTDLLNEWKKTMEEADLWKELKSDMKAFYTQLMQNEEVMKEEAKKVKSDNYDQALKKNRIEMTSYMKKEQRLDEEILRYP
ncbi:hypothetical protein J2S74_002108 [Evansella vedderi]|uniref:Uncharacterized protein n=1 Tax=Evansella vedderi TaxID=38282 RepID=A0ABT9ZU14_9BACI|nr:hypothetical protein [Evansella vedderi]MDQ0254729.1 hypothetical protein [Evansella vedderi]